MSATFLAAAAQRACALVDGTESTANGDAIHHPLLAPNAVEAFQRDGVVVVRGLFAAHVDTLRAGVERNMEDPGPHASENTKPEDTGRFFDDHCNWQRIPEFAEVVRSSQAGAVAAALMISSSSATPLDTMR